MKKGTAMRSGTRKGSSPTKTLLFGRIIALLLLGAFSFQLPVQAGTLRLALLASAETQTDVILLANLLPASADLDLRAAAAKVSLGAAPRIGSVRTISGQSIAAALAQAGLVPNSFVIPEAISVSRPSHLVSRAEIFEAIQSSPVLKSTPQLSGVSENDLQFGGNIRVPAKGTHLSVTKVSYDPFIASVRFQIQPRTIPATLPFYVIVRVPAGSSVSARKAAESSVSGDSRTAVAKALPSLVEPGQMAQLRLHSRDFEIVLKVRPLQRGSLGELIRVRLPGSGKTLQAHVVGPGVLDEML
jgi:Chaperone for flagella basal body P-ring formation